MIPTIVIFIYLALILYVGMFAFRKSTGSKDSKEKAHRNVFRIL